MDLIQLQILLLVAMATIQAANITRNTFLANRDCGLDADFIAEYLLTSSKQTSSVSCGVTCVMENLCRLVFLFLSLSLSLSLCLSVSLSLSLSQRGKSQV